MRALECSCVLVLLLSSCQARSVGESGELVAEDGSTGETGSTGESEGGDEHIAALIPQPPTDVVLSPASIKQFDFTWSAASGAESYQLLERASAEASEQLVGSTTSTSISLTVPLHLRASASYVVRACNDFGCSDSAPVEVVGSLAAAVGYIKASNTGPFNAFGISLALSADGSTLAVGADGEGGFIGWDGYEGGYIGAVYVYVKNQSGEWTQQVRGSNRRTSRPPTAPRTTCSAWAWR